jgi:hypothetical protein
MKKLILALAAALPLVAGAQTADKTYVWILVAYMRSAPYEAGYMGVYATDEACEYTRSQLADHMPHEGFSCVRQAIKN